MKRELKDKLWTKKDLTGIALRPGDKEPDNMGCCIQTPGMLWPGRLDRGTSCWYMASTDQEQVFLG